MKTIEVVAAILMFIYSTNDLSPSTDSTWRYSVIPVWVLRKVITDHDFFGLSEDYFNLCQDDINWWFIDVANSTTTLLKHHADNTVHMWRVVGLRFTTTVTPENG